jgi:hypothetical protein
LYVSPDLIDETLHEKLSWSDLTFSSNSCVKSWGPTFTSNFSMKSCDPWSRVNHCCLKQDVCPEGQAQGHIQALNLTEGMCAPAMAWLA